MQYPILFLDIDGVLNTQKSQDSWKDTTWEFVKFHKESADNFNELLTQIPCDIVMTCHCWKLDYTLKEIRKIFGRYTFHKDGMSYYATPTIPFSSRGKEIRKFLERYDIDPPYLVLDDDKKNVEGIIPESNFVHVEGGWFGGLSMAKVNEAIVKLKKQMGSHV